MTPRSRPCRLRIFLALLFTLAVTPGEAAPTDPQSPASQRFAEAHESAREGDRINARKAFEASIDSLPLLQDHALFYAARMEMEQDETQLARKHLERLLRDHPDSIWVGQALVLRGNLFLAQGKGSDALQDFDQAIRHGPASGRAAARLGRAQALAAAERFPEAWALALELARVSGKVGAGAGELRETLASMGPQKLGTDATSFRLQLARARLAAGEPRRALETLRPLLRGSDPSSARPQAEALAEAAYRASGNTAAAADMTNALIARAQPANLAGDALYGRARRAWNRNEDNAAQKDYRLFLAKFPTHAKRPEALHALARIAESAGDLSLAAQRYHEILVSYPSSRVAETAAWRRGFVLYLASDHIGAAEAWRDLGSKDSGVYWRARALEALQQERIAQKIDQNLLQNEPTSYYSWWLDESGKGIPAAAPAPRKPSTPQPPQSPSAQRHLAKAELLAALRLPESAEKELDAVRQETGNTAFLMQAYADVGAWGRSIRIARAREARGEKGLARAIHPKAHAQEFARAGKRYGVDPLLLASLSRRESLFEERARSPVGAYGLMQLMPATARQLAGRPMPTSELAIPDTNIDLGARYLAQLLKKYQGRLIPALAAYNGGPKAVARWETSNGTRSGDEYVELITYRETRKYVKAVLENYRIYRTLYGSTYPPPRLY
jgi:soluble lytic murein transglycosylase